MSQLRPVAALSLSFSFSLSLSLLAGCSSADFGVSNPGLDAAGDDASLDTATGPDADRVDTSVAEAAGETSADAAREDAVREDAAETSSADANDASDASAPDTCAPNACGGCKALSQVPGEKCGACGVLICGTDKVSVTCNDPGKNLCNGCTALAAKPGDACGVGCGGGTYQCNGTDVLECKGATTANACGGCSALPHALGSACGVCNGGTYVCSPSDKNAVICSDPVTTPAPGTSCAGKCGTLKYVCDAGGKSTSCGADPITTPAPGTPCGGTCGGATYQCDSTNTTTTCVDPAAWATPIGTSCGGICGSAAYACSADKTFTRCVDPVPATAPAISTACGICGSSSNQCNALKTVACVKPDDRSKLLAPNQTASVASFNGVLADRLSTLWLPFTVGLRATRIETVSLELAREPYGCEQQGDCSSPDPQCSCNCTTLSCAPLPTIVTDGLALQLWTGTPAAPGALLETATYKPADVPVLSSAVPAPLTFTFSLDHNLAVGTNVFVRLVASGPSYSYRIYGTAGAVATGVPLYTALLSTLPSKQPFAPYVTVTSYDCP